jgi:hypothetical protein
MSHDETLILIKHVYHEQRHKHYSEFMSVLHFRIRSLIKLNQQMAGRMDQELLQTVAGALISAFI